MRLRVWRRMAGAATLSPPDNEQGVNDMLSKTKMIAAALASAVIAGAAHAASDPAGDFLGTYSGPALADLDIISADARFDGTNFTLTATMNGPITGTPGSLFVWGVNRGAGVDRLNLVSMPALDPTVKWDALAVMATNGDLRVVTLPGPAVSFIPGGTVVNGNTISTSVALASWPSTGFAPTSYTFQLWTRLRANPAMDGTNIEIADFGPRLFASVPEPVSWAMMICGFAVAGTAARRRRRVPYAFSASA